MIRSLKTAAKLTAFAGAFALTGCAFVPESIPLHYKTPTGHGVSVPESITKLQTVTVDVKSLRKHHDVGGRVNAYDMHIAGISVSGGVSNTVKSALVSALTEKGFTVEENGKKTMYVYILSFHGEGHAGLLTGNYRGHTAMRVSIKAPSGKIIYHNTFTTKVRYGGYVLSVSGGTEKVLNALLNNEINKIVDSHALIYALQNHGS